MTDPSKPVASPLAGRVLTVAGIAAVLAAVVILACAAGTESLLGVSGSPVPARWAGYVWLPAGALALVQLVMLLPRFSRPARMVAGAGTLVLFAGTAWAVARATPVPGLDFGLGPRYPLVLVGCLAGIVSGAAAVAGALLARRTGGDAARRRAASLCAAVVLVVAAAAGGGVRLATAWTVHADTEASTTHGALAAQHPARLDGSARWRLPYGTWTPTAGGLVTTAGPGLFAVDPMTGVQRWRYARWGMTFAGRLAVSRDGALLAAANVESSDDDLSMFGYSADTEVTLFDTRTGRVLDSFDAAGGRPLFVSKRLIVVDDGSGGSGSRLRAYRPDGTRLWTFRTAHHCPAAVTTSTASGLLVGEQCDGGPSMLSLLDPGTGHARWNWRTPTHAFVGRDGVAVADQRGEDGGVFLALPTFSSGPHGVERPDHQTVVALDLATGHERWRRALHVGEAYDRKSRVPAGYVALAAGDRLVVGETTDSLTALDLVGLDTATGRQAWRHTTSVKGMSPDLVGTVGGGAAFASAPGLATLVVLRGTALLLPGGDSDNPRELGSRVGVARIDTRTGRSEGDVIVASRAAGAAPSPRQLVGANDQLVLSFATTTASGSTSSHSVALG